MCRKIILGKDGDGHFTAHFSDNPDTMVGGHESEAEAVGTLIIKHGDGLIQRINS